MSSSCGTAMQHRAGQGRERAVPGDHRASLGSYPSSRPAYLAMPYNLPVAPTADSNTYYLAGKPASAQG